MTDINKTIKDYINENIAVSEVDENKVHWYFNSIEKLLSDYWFKDCFLSWSVWRNTSITPVNDIDIICPLKWDYELKSFKFSEVSEIDKLIEALRAEFWDDKVRLQSHSICILVEGDKEDFSIDIVPAIQLDEKNKEDLYYLYKVPSNLLKRKHNNRAVFYEKVEKWLKKIVWEKTDPRGYIYEANQTDNINHNFRLWTLFLKWWSHSVKNSIEEFIKSFHIEEYIKSVVQKNKDISLYEAIKSIENINLDTSVIKNRADSDTDKNIDYYITEEDFQKCKSEIKLLIKNFVLKLKEIQTLKDEKEIIEVLNELVSWKKIQLSNFRQPAIIPSSPHFSVLNSMYEVILVTDRDREFLKKKRFTISDKCIKWTFSFEGYYEDGILQPWYSKSKYYIKGEYDVEIYKSKWKHIVKEVSGKIPRDINNHIDKLWFCCLWVYPNYDISIEQLFQERLFSYFYAWSYYKKFGIYPYWELAHYDEWIFEAISKAKDNSSAIQIFEKNIAKNIQNAYIEQEPIFQSFEAKEWYKKIQKIYWNNPLFTK